MIDTPQVITTTPQHLAKLHLTVPQSEAMNVMGPGLQEVLAAVAAQAIAQTGPWLNHHLRMGTSQVFDFEICVPVAKPIKAAGRVMPGEWPAVKVARTTYRGPYEGLGAAWGEFEEWIKARGLNEDEDLWEVYLVGPESGPDPAKWTTQFNRHLKD